MKRLAISVCASLFTLAAAASTALAQDPAAAQPAVTAEETGGAYPLEFIKRPNTLDAGMLEVRLDLNASLSKDAAFKPFALAPSVFYGVNDKLQVGLVHTDSLCLASEENGRDMVYKGGTLDGQYNFLRDATKDINAHVQLDFNLFKDTADDTKVAMVLRLGVFGSILFGEQLALYFDPQIGIGITEHDAGNKESFLLPFRLAYQATPNLTPSCSSRSRAPSRTSATTRRSRSASA